MEENLEKKAVSLKGLSNSVLNAWSDNRTLVEAFGWNHPALTRQELANIPQKIAEKIRFS